MNDTGFKEVTEKWKNNLVTERQRREAWEYEEQKEARSVIHLLNTTSSLSPQKVFTEPLRVHSEDPPQGQVTREHPVIYFAPFSRETITQFFYGFSHLFKGNLNHTHTHSRKSEHVIIYICGDQRTT